MAHVTPIKKRTYIIEEEQLEEVRKVIVGTPSPRKRTSKRTKISKELQQDVGMLGGTPSPGRRINKRVKE